MDIVKVRKVQLEIHALCGDDATKYDAANRMHTKQIFDPIPNIENKRKRVFTKDIEGKKGAETSSTRMISMTSSVQGLH